jgi:hypothetical protein
MTRHNLVSPPGICEPPAEEAPDQGKGQQRQAEQDRKREVIDHKVGLVRNFYVFIYI